MKIVLSAELSRRKLVYPFTYIQQIGETLNHFIDPFRKFNKDSVVRILIVDDLGMAKYAVLSKKFQFIILVTDYKIINPGEILVVRTNHITEDLTKQLNERKT